MGDGIAAERAGLAIVDVQVTGSIGQEPVEPMSDGLAAERAQLAAAFDAQHFLADEPETLALIEAELAALREPTVTGSLPLMPWEAEEPALMKAYVTGRAAYEAMLTP
jgi:hypothetical protein